MGDARSPADVATAAVAAVKSDPAALHTAGNRAAPNKTVELLKEGGREGSRASSMEGPVVKGLSETSEDGAFVEESSVDQWEDEALSRCSVLTAEEVLRRRAARVRKLMRLYRAQYWALLEELRAKYRRFYLKHGRSGWREEGLLGAASDAGAAAHTGHLPGASGCGGGVAGGGGGVAGGAVGPGGVVAGEPAPPGKAASETLHCAAPGGCKRKPLALSVFCLNHVLQEPRQQLYKPCRFVVRSGPRPVGCGRPVLKILDRGAFCSEHAKAVVEKTRVPDRLLGLVVHHYIATIQKNRRSKKQAQAAEAAAEVAEAAAGRAGAGAGRQQGAAECGQSPALVTAPSASWKVGAPPPPPPPSAAELAHRESTPLPAQHPSPAQHPLPAQHVPAQHPSPAQQHVHSAATLPKHTTKHAPTAASLHAQAHAQLLREAPGGGLGHRSGGALAAAEARRAAEAPTAPTVPPPRPAAAATIPTNIRGGMWATHTGRTTSDLATTTPSLPPGMSGMSAQPVPLPQHTQLPRTGVTSLTTSTPLPLPPHLHPTAAAATHSGKGLPVRPPPPPPRPLPPVVAAQGGVVGERRGGLLAEAKLEPQELGAGQAGSGGAGGGSSDGREGLAGARTGWAARAPPPSSSFPAPPAPPPTAARSPRPTAGPPLPTGPHPPTTTTTTAPSVSSTPLSTGAPPPASGPPRVPSLPGTAGVGAARVGGAGGIGGRGWGEGAGVGSEGSGGGWGGAHAAPPEPSSQASAEGAVVKTAGIGGGSPGQSPEMLKEVEAKMAQVQAELAHLAQVKAQLLQGSQQQSSGSEGNNSGVASAPKAGRLASEVEHSRPLPPAKRVKQEPIDGDR